MSRYPWMSSLPASTLKSCITDPQRLQYSKKVVQNMRTFVATLSVLIWSAAAAPAASPDAKAYERECKDCHLMNGAPDKSVDKAMQKKGVKMRNLAAKEIQE